MSLNRNRRVTSQDKYFATSERYLTGEVAVGRQSKYVPVPWVVPASRRPIVPTFYRDAIEARVGKWI